MEQGNLGAVEDSELVGVLLYGALLGLLESLSRFQGLRHIHYYIAITSPFLKIMKAPASGVPAPVPRSPLHGHMAETVATPCNVVDGPKYPYPSTPQALLYQRTVHSPAVSSPRRHRRSRVCRTYSPRF